MNSERWGFVVYWKIDCGFSTIKDKCKGDGVVMKKIGFVLLMLLFSGFIMVCSAECCTYSIELTDDFGDGWNGGSITVSVNGTAVLTDLTLASGSGPEASTFDVESGDVISTDYTGGGWSYENYYAIYDADGTLVAESGNSGVVPVDMLDIAAVCGDATSIPTLSEWGMIILALLLGTGAVLVLRQRKTEELDYS